MCSCEAHQSEVAPCTCLCKTHDRYFETGVVLLREEVRRLTTETQILQERDRARVRQQVVLSERLTKLESASPLGAVLASAHEGWERDPRFPSATDGENLPSDIWDRYGVQWGCIGGEYGDYIWQWISGSYSGAKILNSGHMMHRGPFTATSPLAEDAQPESLQSAVLSVSAHVEPEVAEAWHKAFPADTDADIVDRLRDRAERAEAETRDLRKALGELRADFIRIQAIASQHAAYGANNANATNEE